MIPRAPPVAASTPMVRDKTLRSYCASRDILDAGALVYMLRVETNIKSNPTLEQEILIADILLP